MNFTKTKDKRQKIQISGTSVESSKEYQRVTGRVSTVHTMLTGRTRLPQLVLHCSRRYIQTATSVPVKGSVKKSSTPATKTITEESDFAFRKNQISTLPYHEQDCNYYPTLKDVTSKLVEGMKSDVRVEKVRVPEFKTRYEGKITPDNTTDFDSDPLYIISGKVGSIRKAGKGSMFIDIWQDMQRVQLIVHHKVMGLERAQFIELHGGLRPGDQIMGIGRVGVTKVGELSVKLIQPITLAAPSLHPIPVKFNDSGKVNANRVIDYLANKRSVEVMVLRSSIIKLIREFLEEREFMAVETPIICSGNSGANATPFGTISQHVQMKDETGGDVPVKLNLRVAPELWLKRLIIAGFDKVYEIGKSFRNEGIDSTHNPEFTTCEFYQTFIGLDELMKMSEEMIVYILNGVLRDAHEGGKLHSFKDKSEEILKLIEANGGQFKRIEFLPELQVQTGVELRVEDLTKEGLAQFYSKVNKNVDPESLKHRTSSDIINTLTEEYLEPLCVGSQIPTFIYNVPEIVSPLAKSDKFGISQRFECFIDGREYMNAYEEENNPFKQAHKFTQQQINKDMGDMESIIPDSSYVKAMEWGMPPTGGWGMGVDRLVMLLAGVNRIEGVISFGRLSDVVRQ
jgi:lysyl-tRNA synthetase class 2